ncbi:MAG: hypothetical protein COB49_02370 [Alphaproteobacteria bacterium]|nr:MAG: hypothetical protein COB49_02370 [Alphaproteobacteria bacterium]
MTPQTSKNAPKNAPKAGNSFVKICEEMNSLGLDPKPLLKIAANDIVIRHGIKGVAYAELMLDQMIENNNPEGIFLWKELYCILNNLFSTTNRTLN